MMGDPALHPPPLMRVRARAKEKEKEKAKKAKHLPLLRLVQLRPSIHLPWLSHQLLTSKKIRVESLESESENDQLFAPGIADEDETPQAGISTGGKQDCLDDLLCVEIEEALPPHKMGKMAYVAFGEVCIIVHICNGSPGMIASTGLLQPLH